MGWWDGVWVVGVGVAPVCQGRFVIRDGSISSTKVPLHCLLGPWGQARR